MHRVRIITTAVLAICFLAAPLRADVIRAARAAAPPTLASSAPLERAGLSAAQIATLDPEDVTYFARAPERIQVVGDTGLSTAWYERYGGYLLGVGAIALLATIVINNRDT